MTLETGQHPVVDIVMEVGAINQQVTVTGDFSHSSDYRILQLWNDGGSATFDFDDVSVARPSQAPTAPDAPTGVSAQAGNGAATVTWTAPANAGGSPITSYRITPHAGATALTPVDTGSATAGPSRSSHTILRTSVSTFQ